MTSGEPSAAAREAVRIEARNDITRVIFGGCQIGYFHTAAPARPAATFALTIRHALDAFAAARVAEERERSRDLEAAAEQISTAVAGMLVSERPGADGNWPSEEIFGKRWRGEMRDAVDRVRAALRAPDRAQPCD